MDNMSLYYVDGYHGGIRGHMDLGCWRDILEMMKQNPEWKISIDMEAISWDYLEYRDPDSYLQLREMLKDQSAESRVEIVAGSLGQPYCWTIGGESNIRHLTMGFKILAKHFPWLKVETYAVQEPCWTSALPQILKSMGFKRAVLKNPSTAWAGYSEGIDEETCLWEGPDGTRIPIVPRYACENLQKVWETESAGGTEEFVEKCTDNNIKNPAGMFYQDLGWPAYPQLSNKAGYDSLSAPKYLTYTTWREYFEKIASVPVKVWKISQETFRVALPWGERVLVRMARQVRRGETGILLSERLQALAHILGGLSGNFERLNDTWMHVLLAQHHDGWICATTGKEEDNWAWKTSAQIYAAENQMDILDRQAMSVICNHLIFSEGDSYREFLCVANPLGRAEMCTVSAEITSPRGIKSFHVYDGEKYIESQYIAKRYYADGSKNAGLLVFQAYFPGFGVKTFRIEPSDREEEKGGVFGYIDRDYAYLESSCFRLVFALNAGGTILSLFDKQSGLEVVDSSSSWKFNEYRGYFIKDSEFRSSTESRAKAELIINGPIQAILKISGQVGNAGFTQIITLTDKDRKILIDVTFHFPEETYIGEPHVIEPEHNQNEGHRSYHDGRFKLNAYFPTTFSQDSFYKDAAYDVCESKHEETYFKNWSEIKHNVLLGWIDVTDYMYGLAIMSDHTTSYIHGPDHPLGLTMAWGWDGGYWWGRRELKGDHKLQYAIVPHPGNWYCGDIWHEYQRMLYPPIAKRIAGNAPATRGVAIITVERPVEMSAVYLDEENRLLVRLFNPGKSVQIPIVFDCRIAGFIELIELEGTRICCIEEKERMCDKYAVTIAIPAFGIRTLRITFSQKKL